MDDSGAGDRQGHSTSVLRHPAVVAAVITVLGGMVVALISLMKADPPGPVVVVGPTTPDNLPTRLQPTPDAPSAPIVPEDAPVVGIPDQAIGRWRGGVGFSGFEVPADLTVTKVPVGESVGDFRTQLAGDLGSCTYRAQLMSVDADHIVLRTSKTKGGDFCGEWGLVRLDFDDSGRARFTADGLPANTLYRS